MFRSKALDGDIQRGVRNLYRPILDSCRLYDASRLPPRLIAQEDQRILSVHDIALYQQIQRQAEVTNERFK